MAPRTLGLVLGYAILGVAPLYGDPVRDALDQASQMLHQGDGDAVLAALQAAEELEPDNPWLLFYKGAAYQLLGRPYRAIECFDRASDVLAGLGDPDPALAGETRRRRQAARREVFSFSIQFGPAYDSNVSFAGQGAQSLGLVAGRGDGKFASGLQLSYAPLKNERDSLTLGLRLGHSWHCSIDQFDFQDYGATVRYARKLGRGWEGSLAYDYDFSLLGRDAFLSSHALTAALAYERPASPAKFRFDRTTLSYRVQFQDFLFDTAPRFDRDGVAHSVGLEQSWMLRPARERAWTCGLRAGYRFESVATEGTEFDYFGHDLYLGLNIPLVRPWDPDRFLILPDNELIFRFDADWLIADYRRRSRIDRDRDTRQDLITTLGFTLSQTLMQDTRRGDLVLHGIIHWTDAESNVTARGGVSPFTYEKVIYGLQLQWTW